MGGEAPDHSLALPAGGLCGFPRGPREVLGRKQGEQESEDKDKRSRREGRKGSRHPKDRLGGSSGGRGGGEGGWPCVPRVPNTAPPTHAHSRHSINEATVLHTHHSPTPDRRLWIHLEGQVGGHLGGLVC